MTTSTNTSLGLAPVIGVIAHEPNSGERTMQVRVAGSGVFDDNIVILNANWEGFRLYND